MTDVRAAKRALARLADPTPVEDGERALRGIERAAAFREAGGLARVRHVAERADGDRARRARAVLVAFDRFERATAGSIDPDHFRRGRDTPLRDGG